MQSIRDRIAPLFCPSISTHPSIDYSRVVEDARRDYPGAGDDLTAVVYGLKHRQMSITNAKAALFEIWEQEARQRYADQWVSRYMQFLEE